MGDWKEKRNGDGEKTPEFSHIGTKPILGKANQPTRRRQFNQIPSLLFATQD